jgi:hypothetical protein
MSGSSILTAVFCCTNCCILDEEKKKTITYDAELLLGKDENDEDHFINIIVHFFISKGEMEPEEDIYLFVIGKIISIKNDTVVGDNQSVEDYNLELDAFVVCNNNNSFRLSIMITLR